jgi:hypothetical protein
MGKYKLSEIAPGIELTQDQLEHLYMWGEYGYTPARISSFYDISQRPRQYAIRRALMNKLHIADEGRIIEDSQARSFYMSIKHKISDRIPEDLVHRILEQRYTEL